MKGEGRDQVREKGLQRSWKMREKKPGQLLLPRLGEAN
jgi:hypothetical protein